jgi:hypothetical protein
MNTPTPSPAPQPQKKAGCLSIFLIVIGGFVGLILLLSIPAHWWESFGSRSTSSFPELDDLTRQWATEDAEWQQKHAPYSKGQQDWRDTRSEKELNDHLKEALKLLKLEIANAQASLNVAIAHHINLRDPAATHQLNEKIQEANDALESWLYSTTHHNKWHDTEYLRQMIQDVNRLSQSIDASTKALDAEIAAALSGSKSFRSK